VKINHRHAARVTRAEREGWLRGLLATPERRRALVALALLFSLVIQLMNLLDVFDGAAAGVWIAVIAAQILCRLAGVTGQSALGSRERGRRA
jgi:hypothetical protein